MTAPSVPKLRDGLHAIATDLATSPVLDRQRLLEGVTFERREHAVVLLLANPWQCLSSAVMAGGRRHARSVLHVRVPRGYACSRPERDLRAAGRALRLPGPTVGLMTAVDLAETQIYAARAQEVEVRALVTVGLGNAARAGHQSPPGPGTINIILLIDHRVADGAAVEAAMIVAEAKAATLVESGTRTRDGRLASGTSTDAIAVLWRRGEGREIRHAGSATALGTVIASIVSAAIERVVPEVTS